MSRAAARPRISPEEYYALDAAAMEKSDWYEGEMFSMAGGTTNHSRIRVNLSRSLGNLRASIGRIVALHGTARN